MNKAKTQNIVYLGYPKRKLYFLKIFNSHGDNLSVLAAICIIFDNFC